MHLWRSLALLVLTASCAAAQFKVPGANTFGRRRAVRARLVLSHEAAKPGDTVMAGIELTHNPGWHTYWQNSGESGDATKIFWALTNGISPGEIQWPVPEKFVDPTVSLTTYVYHDRAVLLVPMKVASDAPSGTNGLLALVKWLECEQICVPGSNIVRATLTIGNESKLSAETNFFAEARRRMPSKQLPGSATASWDAPGNAVRPLVINWNAEAKAPDFFPFTNALVIISNKTDVLSTTASNVVLRKLAKRTGDQWPAEVAGLLVREENGKLAGYEVSLPVAGASGADAKISPGSFTQPSKSLFVWLLYAFIGGLILNIMPCVLPVIALKILGFVSQSHQQPARVRTLGLLYTLGVIVSFLALAGIVIGVKAAGQKAGWGMQFGNPQFLAVLSVIVTLVALNLLGVFEITLTGRAMGAAGQASSKHGTAGAFMNGVLATVLATPCSAPFLGAALGFAFVQPPAMIILFFLTLGLGLAAPYLILSWNPKLLKFLPKPGAWMERFKVAMAFPMLATTVWLVSLTPPHYGQRFWWLGMFLVIVALAAWIYGEFVQRGRKHRGVALALALVLLAGGYTYAMDTRLRWRSPVAGTEQSDAFQETPDGIVWQRWSPETVTKYRAEGRPIFVDFTAIWCQVCQVNKLSSIEIDSVRAKLKEINAVALLADYTKLPAIMTTELEKFGRAAVPLVVVYPKDPNRPPVVLPEILTPGIVLKALDEAAK